MVKVTKLTNLHFMNEHYNTHTTNMYYNIVWVPAQSIQVQQHFSDTHQNRRKLLNCFTVNFYLHVNDAMWSETITQPKTCFLFSTDRAANDRSVSSQTRSGRSALTRTERVGSLVQSIQWPFSTAWVILTKWCIRSGCWLVRWVSPSSCRDIHSRHGGEVNRWRWWWRWSFAGTNNVSDLTGWWDILTKNTPPSTFRARLPVTLAEWQLFHSVARLFTIEFTWQSIQKSCCFILF